MLCSVCYHLNFRSLEVWNKFQRFRSYINHEWQDFDARHISEEMSGRHGDYLERSVYCLHHKDSRVLVDSARQGCHLCAMIAYGLFYDESVKANDEHLTLPEPHGHQPVVLCILASSSRPWYEAPMGEWFHVYCGTFHCRLTIMSAEDSR